MLLRSLTLEDFGAYRGAHTLDLTTSSEKPIVLIGGLNGCGKTTLLDAIQLVLYGARARCSGRGNRPYEAYLRESINRKADPAKGASIALEFTITVDNEERLYKLHRSWKASGKTLNEFTTVLIDGKVDPVAGQNWADYVEDLLPLEVASLFFFDGEKVESLADPERAATVIESAVQSLLGVNTIEQLRSDLLGLQRRHRLTNEDQKVVDRIHELQEALDQTVQQIDDAKQLEGAKRSDLDQAQKDLVAANHAFEKEGGELFQQRTALDNESKAVAKQLAQAEEALRHDIAGGGLPLLLVRPQIEEIREQALREKEAAEAKHVVDALEKRDTWFAELLPDFLSEEKRDAILEKLAEDRERRRESAATPQILGLSDKTFNQLTALNSVLEHERQRAQAALSQAQEHRQRQETLDRMLGAVPQEDSIAKRLAERDRAVRKVALLEAELNAASEHLVATQRHSDNLKSELEQALKGRLRSIEKAERSARIIAYADRYRSTLEKFKRAVLQHHINRLEVAVLDSFNRLMRKSGLVRDLRIDTADKFRLTLVDSEGEELDPSRLSAGERQLLAISLLWGLARVAGNWLPSVIDTPLGRLDSKHREHLVERYFPQASHQVLLLSTDEEIDEPLLKKLRPSIAHTYTLEHDETTFTTSVERGYWWTGGTAHVA